MKKKIFNLKDTSKGEGWWRGGEEERWGEKVKTRLTYNDIQLIMTSADDGLDLCLIFYSEKEI